MERRQTRSGPGNPRHSTRVSSLGFLFCLIYPRCGAGKVCTGNAKESKQGKAHQRERKILALFFWGRELRVVSPFSLWESEQSTISDILPLSFLHVQERESTLPLTCRHVKTNGLDFSNMG